MPELKLGSLPLERFEEIARKLAGVAKKQDVITLNGDLGAGKTTFSRAFIGALLKKKTEITSPTFNLVQLYETPAFEIWHYDLYRLKHEEELAELGLEDAFAGAVTLIEWPEIAAALLPNHRLEIHIGNGKTEDERTLTLIYPNHWKDRIHALFKH